MSEDSPEVRAMWAPQVRVVAPADEPGALPSPRTSESTSPAAEESGDFVQAPFVAARPARPDARTLPLPQKPATASAIHAAAAAPAFRRGLPWIGLLLAIVAAVSAAAFFVNRAHALRTPSIDQAALVVQGTATIVSRPTGAEVLVNGVSRGTTPLRLTLPAGTYDVELRNGASKRSLSVTVDPSTATREFVDLAPDGGLGSVEITTDAPGARVTIDGVVRGVTPLVVPGVEPGSHRVGVSSGDSTIYRTVTVTAGATATVVASATPSGSAGGWLTISAPIELQVVENGDVIGTSGAARIMLPAGHHDLRLLSVPYEFETTVPVQIGVGRTQVVPVDVPNGTLSVNASPWADVFLDGRSIGSTPIGNLSVTVGPHEVVWRHPQLGERRQTVRVGARTPVHVGIDLTKSP